MQGFPVPFLSPSCLRRLSTMRKSRRTVYCVSQDPSTLTTAQVLFNASFYNSTDITLDHFAGWSNQPQQNSSGWVQNRNQNKNQNTVRVVFISWESLFADLLILWFLWFLFNRRGGFGFCNILFEEYWGCERIFGPSCWKTGQVCGNLLSDL